MSRFTNLDKIQPDVAEEGPSPSVAKIDAAAARHGFSSREPLVRRKRQSHEGPADQINIRASITDINRFVEWCERNRFTNREGFAEMVKRLD